MNGKTVDESENRLKNEKHQSFFSDNNTEALDKAIALAKNINVKSTDTNSAKKQLVQLKRANRFAAAMLCLSAMCLCTIFIIALTVNVKQSNAGQDAEKANNLAVTIFGNEDSGSFNSDSSLTQYYSSPANNGDIKDGFTVVNLSSGKLETDKPELIVAQVLEAEMGGDKPAEALKAQAVAIYSFLKYHNADKGDNPSVYMTAASPECLAAANAVKNQTIQYNGRPIEALWFEISAGKTADNADVWGNTVAYLKSVDSGFDSSAKEFSTTRTFKSSDIAKAVKDEYGVDLSKVSKDSWFKCSYDRTGLYVKSVSLGGKKNVSGMSVKYNLISEERFNDKLLNSHAFTVKYDSKSDSFVFTVKGKGNGVGMSVYGAQCLAKDGKSYEDILKHYYKNTTIAKGSCG